MRGGIVSFRKVKEIMIRRRKECYFTKNKISYIDYKDTKLLSRFISRNGKITPRRITGTKNKYQKALAIAIKRARIMALIAYSDE